MISKRYIKALQFDNIQDIFNYIVESDINGNFKQHKELINKLSKDQFKDFINWLELDNIQIQNAIRVRR